MAKATGIGILGAQFAGKFHTEMWRVIRDAEVVAIADLSPKAREDYVKEFGPVPMYRNIDELLSDPKVEVIDICVPNFLHAQIAIKAMEAGKHVICEKPFATTLEDALKVIDAQKRTGQKYFYAEDWIFAPALVRAEKLLNEGGIGKPLFFKGKECHNGSHSPFAKTIHYCGGGSMIHVGIHAIGYFFHLLGMPEKVTGCCNGGYNDNFIHKDFEGEDWGLAILHYPGGQKALVEGNYITTGGMNDIMEVYGTDGLIRVDLTFGSPVSVFSKKGITYAVEKAEFTQGWTKPAVNEFESLGYKDELSHFLHCIREDVEQVSSTTAEAGYNVLKIVDAIYRSNREQKTVTV